MEQSSDQQVLTADFDARIKEDGLFPLRATVVDTLQINLGYMCNQVCVHCHVNAGPDRTEIMKRETLVQCLKVVKENSIECVDLTGGAPEMNPHFRWFSTECRALGTRVIVRSNLTIMSEPGHEDLPEFDAEHKLDIVASLPCYTEENVDKQRGKGTFERSIDAIRRLNKLCYAQQNSELKLDLVFNPSGPSLPGDQTELEADFKRELDKNFGIKFNNLFTITNMPIGRFGRMLARRGQLDPYIDLLASAYNAYATERVMCRNLISVGWDGFIYDCDFNQMLNLRTAFGAPTHIDDFDYKSLVERRIATGSHCFGCTAGAGSSCSGALASSQN